MLASDYISDVRELVHDLTTQDWSDTELLNWVNQARQRAALDFHCVRQFFVNLNLIANQEIYPITGGVGGLRLTAGGTGYTSPTVSIAAPPAGGITATASATATAGVITSVQITNWGTGYVSTPAVTFGGGGAGAAASAVALTNVLDPLSCSVLYAGNQQGYMLQWWPFSIFQAWARSSRQQFQMPGVWSHITEMNQLYFGRPPDQAYTLEIDAVVMPVDLPLTTSTDSQVILPQADAVKFYASHLALLKLQNFEHADYYKKAYMTRVKEIQGTRQDRRIPNIYNNTFRRMMRGW